MRCPRILGLRLWVPAIGVAGMATGVSVAAIGVAGIATGVPVAAIGVAGMDRGVGGMPIGVAVPVTGSHPCTSPATSVLTLYFTLDPIWMQMMSCASPSIFRYSTDPGLGIQAAGA